MKTLSIRAIVSALIGLIGLFAIALAGQRLLESSGRKDVADATAEYMGIDRNLFVALTRLRVERGYAMNVLKKDLEAGRTDRQISEQSRAPLDEALKEALADLRQIPSMAGENLTSLDTLFAEWLSLRRPLDTAFDQAVTARDPALLPRIIDLGARILSVIERLTDMVEGKIQTLNKELGVPLNAKAMAWLTRTTVGQADNINTLAMIDGRQLTAAEMIQLRDLRTQGQTAWTLAGRTIETSNFPPAVKDKYARGTALYYGGTLSEMRRAVIEAQSEGRKAQVAQKEWDAAVVVGQRSLVDAALAIMDTTLAQTRAVSDEMSRSFMAYSAVLALLMSLLVVAILIVHFRVVGGILRLASAMRWLSEGKLDTDVPGTDRADELGRMAAAVQVFKDNLVRTRRLEEETALARASAEEQRKRAMREMADGFEAAVGGVIGMVSSSATELQATAQQMTSTASETASQSTVVAAAAEEAASNVNTVAAAAEQLGSSVQEIGRQVDGSADLARQAVAEADQVGTLVQELSGAVSRIGDVVGLISTIAGQTNLLALNATIEAARAGAAGKGFAVVASEVKALAEQTAKATTEISGQIMQIRASTGQAVASIRGITGRIHEISAVSTSIAAAVEEQGAATQEIVRNVAQAAAGAGEVTGNIAGVAGAAEETGAAANQVLGAASELSRQSEHLTSEVARFLATVRAA